MARYGTVNPFKFEDTYAGLPVDAIGANLARQQQRYDVTQANMMQYNEQLAAIQAREAETSMKKELVDGLQSDLKKATDKYHGDIGAARNEILSAISKNKRDPRWMGMTRALELEKTARADKGRYGATAIDFNPEAWNTPITYNKATGELNLPDYKIESRVAHRPIREQYFNQITANAGDISPDKLAQNIEGYIRTGSWKGITDSRIRNYAKQAYEDYKNTSSYDQAIREKKLKGIKNPDSEVAKEFLTSGLEHVFSQTDSRYMADRGYDPNGGGDPTDLKNIALGREKTLGEEVSTDAVSTLKEIKALDVNTKATKALEDISSASNEYLSALWEETKKSKTRGSGYDSRYVKKTQHWDKDTKEPYFTFEPTEYGKKNINKLQEEISSKRNNLTQKAVGLNGSELNAYYEQYPDVPQDSIVSALAERNKSSITSEYMYNVDMGASWDSKVISDIATTMSGKQEYTIVEDGKRSSKRGYASNEITTNDINSGKFRVIPSNDPAKSKIAIFVPGKTENTNKTSEWSIDNLEETPREDIKQFATLASSIKDNRIVTEPFKVVDNLIDKIYNLQKQNIYKDGKIVPVIVNLDNNAPLTEEDIKNLYRIKLRDFSMYYAKKNPEITN